MKLSEAARDRLKTGSLAARAVVRSKDGVGTERTKRRQVKLRPAKP